MIVIALSFLVGCSASPRSLGENIGCDTYIRSTSRQSDVTVFVPHDDSLIV
jgi:hypothetical protein